MRFLAPDGARNDRQSGCLKGFNGINGIKAVKVAAFFNGQHQYINFDGINLSTIT